MGWIVVNFVFFSLSVEYLAVSSHLSRVLTAGKGEEGRMRSTAVCFASLPPRLNPGAPFKRQACK